MLRSKISLVFGLVLGASLPGTSEAVELDESVVELCGASALFDKYEAALGPATQAASSVLSSRQVIDVISKLENTKSDHISAEFQEDQWNKFISELDVAVELLEPEAGEGSPAELLMREIGQVKLILAQSDFFSKISHASRLMTEDNLINRISLPDSGATISAEECEGIAFPHFDFSIEAQLRVARVPNEFDIFLNRVRRIMTSTKLITEECPFSAIVAPSALVVGNGVQIRPENHSEKLRLLQLLQSEESGLHTTLTVGAQKIDGISLNWWTGSAVSLQWWVAGIAFERTACED